MIYTYYLHNLKLNLDRSNNVNFNVDTLKCAFYKERAEIHILCSSSYVPSSEIRLSERHANAARSLNSPVRRAFLTGHNSNIIMHILCLAALFIPFAHGAISLSNIPGVYTLEHKDLSFCTDVLEFRGSGGRLNATDVLWDKEECRSGYATLEANTWNNRWPIEWKSALGPIVNGTLHELLCQRESPIVARGFIFMRPVASIKVHMQSTVVRYLFRKGTQYFTIWNRVGQCVYKLRPEPSPTPSATPPNTTGDASTASDSATKEAEPTSKPVLKEPVAPETTKSSASTSVTSQPDRSEKIWVWLGPVLGAAATIIASLIAVFCVRQGRGKHGRMRNGSGIVYEESVLAGYGKNNPW